MRLSRAQILAHKRAEESDEEIKLEERRERITCHKVIKDLGGGSSQLMRDEYKSMMAIQGYVQGRYY